ncbi:MAG: hypothetical protein R3C03_20705 [Pirellulaceae bacterium]
MKLIGIGVEPTIPNVPTYFDTAIENGANVSSMDVARWWFTLAFDGVAVNQDQTVFELLGTGVRVLSETEFLDQQGNRIHTGNAVGPTKQFAEDFTEHFDELAGEYPIFNELRNVFDLAIVSSLIKRERLDEQIQWDLDYCWKQRTASFVIDSIPCRMQLLCKV